METRLQNLALTLLLLSSAHQAVAQTLTNIVVNPPDPTIAIGTSQQFTATGYFSDGSSSPLVSSNWVFLAGLPAPIAGGASTAVNGELYVVGDIGGGGGGTPEGFYAYNPASNSWTTDTSFADPNTPDPYAVAAAIGNQLYIIGGCEGNDCRIGPTASVRVYDTVAESWTNAAPMNMARFDPAVGVIDGMIYVAGGTGPCPPCDPLDSLEVYNPASNTWTFMAPMPTARGNLAGTVINGIFYAVGGFSSSSTSDLLGTVEAYDPALNSWTTKASMPTPRASMGVVAVGDLLFAISGLTTNGVTNLVEVYNSDTDTWTNGEPTLTAHLYGQAAAIGNTIYLAGCGSIGAETNLESLTVTAGEGLAWSSSASSVATIDTNGLASGLSTGNSTITASLSGTSGSTTLTVSAPSLSIESAGNQSVLYWPAADTNYVLQMTTNLSTPNWVTVSNGIPIIGVTLTNASPAAYFRLQLQ